MANYTPALKNGKLQEVNDKEVEYEFVSPNDFFGDNINLMPMMSAVPPQRNFYSAKFHSQTVPLKNPEAPLVQTLKDADKQISYEDYIGKKMGTVYADPEDGDVEILKITPDQITYKTAKGLTKSKDLYNNFNFNRKTAVTNTPVVKKGDIVKAGSLLAKSNFTDDKGTMAFGVNAYTAIIPYKGWTMDDAVVISEDFAKKLTSQHSYKFQETDDKTRKTNKAHFSSLFPKAFTKEQLDNVDDNGVVKVGTIVKEGDPLILSTTPRMVSSKESQLGKLSKYLRNTRTDASVKWDHQDDGIVTDVVKSKNGWKVNVQSYAIARPADKITQRSGNKGLISKIIPQELMPRDSEGTPFDVLFNPLGLVSRVNANLVYETLLGKVAKKTGKVYKLPAFNNQDESWHDFVKSELDKNGISDKDRVYDPEDDRWIEKPVTTGYLYIQKLHHTGESKLSARGQGLYCYSDDTEVLTKQGWKNWADVNLTDEFYTINSDNKGIFVKADKLHKYWYEGDMISIQSKYIDSLVTPNHRHYIKTPHVNEFRFKLAKDLPKRFNLKQFGFKPTDPTYTSEYITLPEVTKKYEDYTKIWHSITVPIKPLVKLMGWYVAEGCITLPNAKAKRWRFNICQSYSTNPVKCEEIENAFKDLGLKYTKWGKSNGMISWDISNAVFVEWVYSNFGRYSHGKYIGDIIFNLPLELKWEFLNAYILGDGNTSSDGLAASTDSLQLVNDLQRLAITMGIGAIPSLAKLNCDKPILPKKNKKIYTRDKNKPHYYIGFHLQRQTSTVNTVNPKYTGSIERVPYKGYVYCATLSTGLLYVRRNFKPLLSGNSLEHLPLKGGDEGTQAKRVSGLENSSLLSAGAYNVIKDAASLRGQQNDEYWRKVRSGELPSLAKKSPFVWDKFIAILQGTGINPVKKGPNGETIRLSPFTDRQLEQAFKPVEVKNGEILDFRTLQPVEGGLFDPAMGVTSKWGKITLAEPVINPAFENTVAALLGVKKSDLYSIISGEKDLENYGTGSIAIQKALKDIDIKKMFNESAKTFKSGPKTHKQKALNRMNYIKGLVRNEISPEELMITKVPVLPQAFRPYSIMGDTFIPGDVNELYKEVFNVNQAHKELKDEIGEEEARSNSMNLYNSVKALYGIEGSNNRKLQQRGVSGFMDKLVGGTAKFSYAQSKLWSKPVDFSGRAAINPNPELSMDEVGIPYDIAWKIYSPWIQRELSKRGMPLAESVKAIEERTPEAKQALEQVVKEKAVIYSRAPSWHKFGLLGGFAKLHNGKNILINPLTASGLGADYDGDCQIGNIFIALPRN